VVFLLNQAVVERELRRTAPPEVGSWLAQSVAAHLEAPGTPDRVAWERRWLGALAGGDALLTALPELLWRTGGDDAIRTAARAWPTAAWASLGRHGIDNAPRAAAELAVAALLDPSTIDFKAPAVAPALIAPVTGDGEFWLGELQIRCVTLVGDSGALAVSAVGSAGAVAWSAVRYSLTGEYDAVPVEVGTELALPMRGVSWAGAFLVGLKDNGHLSLAIRPLDDTPIHLKRWDFSSTDAGSTIAWETSRHTGLRGFVVESLTRSATGAYQVRQRNLIPAVEDTEESFSYTFVDEDRGDTAAYRLRALTASGFLTELSTFPLDRHR
jgi:hypothetical protein